MKTKLLYALLLISCITTFSQKKIILNDKTVEISASKIHASLFEKKEDGYLKFYNNFLLGSLPNSEYFNKILGEGDMKNRAIVFIHRKFKKGSFTRPLVFEDIASLSDDIYNDIKKKYEIFYSVEDIQVMLNLINEEISILNKLKKTENIKDLESIKRKLINQLDPVKKGSFIDTLVATSLTDVRAILMNDYEKLETSFVSDNIETFVIVKRGNKWSDDIVGINNILYVIIDGKGDLGKGKFKIDNKKSSFSQELDDVGDLALKLFKMGRKDQTFLLDEKVNVRLVELAHNKINPPSEINYIYKLADSDNNDTIKIDIKEKIRANLKLGITSAQVERSLFKIDNKQLIISPDSVQTEEIKQHLALNFVFRPFYHTDEYKPKFFKYDYENNVLKRLGIIGGFNFSLTPFDNLYLGVSYDLSEYFTFVTGYTWNNILDSDTIDIGDISSVKDALSLARKDYGDRQLFFGLSFSPSTITKILGIKEDD
ncbi:hypothetical protein SAMN05421640_1673 [Ekhidna lutea]|uniref:Uncharacterized protein n=1 Tax=Ekhidna lutea TaxID=447679 RepID=A0A239IIC2_EKHLU|nr:hypothetical protein [Ekhidna lutea]SNS93152.1 hypothetical protein SAMN05421640_1673 [Ekhidna lutea]